MSFWISSALVNLIAFMLLSILDRHLFYSGNESQKWVSRGMGISVAMFIVSVVIAIGGAL